MYARLKDLLFHIKMRHEYPKWFDMVSEKELVDELMKNGVIYKGRAIRKSMPANPYDKPSIQNIEILNVDEKKAKVLYDIDFDNI